MAASVGTIVLFVGHSINGFDGDGREEEDYYFLHTQQKMFIHERSKRISSRISFSDISIAKVQSSTYGSGSLNKVKQIEIDT